MIDVCYHICYHTGLGANKIYSTYKQPYSIDRHQLTIKLHVQSTIGFTTWTVFSITDIFFLAIIECQSFEQQTSLIFYCLDVSTQILISFSLIETIHSIKFTENYDVIVFDGAFQAFLLICQTTTPGALTGGLSNHGNIYGN